MNNLKTFLDDTQLLRQRKMIYAPDLLYKNFLKKYLQKANNILIADGENFIPIIDSIIENNLNLKITVAIRDKNILNSLKNNKDFSNIKFLSYDSIEKITPTNDLYDLILAFPIMGSKLLHNQENYISDRLELAETENLLKSLANNTKLCVLLPYGVTFWNDVKSSNFRKHVMQSYNINKIVSLPVGFLAPYAAVQTALFEISYNPSKDVKLELYTNKNKTKDLKLTNSCSISYEKLVESNSWDLNRFLASNDETLQKYFSSNVKKIKLSEIAEVYRGKTIKDYTDDGNIAVINISNVIDSTIDFENIKYIKDDERKNMRFALYDNDIVLTARGSELRTAIFKKPDNKMYITSANIIVIHQNNASQQQVLQLFFESSIGQKLLNTCKKGTSMMNIVPKDIQELLVPLWSNEQTIEFSEEYSVLKNNLIKEKEKARNIIKNAENKLQQFCEKYANKLV